MLKKSLCILLSLVMAISTFSVAVVAEADSDYTITVSGTEATITAYNGDDTELDIPDTIGNYTVVAIGDEAFSGNQTLESVSIPDTVTSIGEKAFYDCEELTYLTIGSGVSEIGDAAFFGCISLLTVTVSDDNETFTSEDDVILTADGATLVLFPAGSTAVSYEVPSTVTAIGNYAFAYNTTIEEIILPDGLVEIGEWCFYHCIYLESIELPEGLETVGTCSFIYCLSLTEIVIPVTVTEFGSQNFYGCSSLTDIYFLNPDCEIGESTSFRSFNLDGNNGVAFTIYGYEGSTAETVAGYYSMVTFEALEDVITTEATCTTNGLKNVFLASTGELLFEGVLTVGDHDYELTESVDATCTEDGYDVYTCSVCGETYTETTEATGHTYKKVYTYTDEDTGEIYGYYYECSVCKDYYYVETDGHIYSYDLTSPTCTKSGKIVYTCQICGYTYTETLSATGHSYYWTTVSKKPTKICSVCGKVAVTLKFTDISSSEYKGYYNYIAYTSSYNSFIRGTDSTTFAPKKAVTRAAIIAILYRMAGSPSVSGSNPFSDVKKTDYYYSAALWAYKNGITTETKFKGTKSVTREQTATFFYRYAKYYLGEDVSSVKSISSFPDASSVSSWAKTAMKWAYSTGMITGNSSGKLNPQGTTYRIYFSKIVYKFGKAYSIGNFS